MVGPALRREPCRGAEHPGPQGARSSFITVTLMRMGLVCWTLQAVGFSLNVMNWKESMKHACPVLENIMQQFTDELCAPKMAQWVDRPQHHATSLLFIYCAFPQMFLI